MAGASTTSGATVAEVGLDLLPGRDDTAAPGSSRSSRYYGNGETGQTDVETPCYGNCI